MKRLLVLIILGLLAAFLPQRRSQAIKPAGLFAQDAKRFALNAFSLRHRRDPAKRALKAFAAYNQSEGGGWRASYHPRTGALRLLTGGASRPRPGRPEEAAAAYLRDTRDLTDIDPAGLSLKKQIEHQGISHLLYAQTYKGLPVEFGRVKVHVDGRGQVLGLSSTFEPNLNFDINPSLTSQQAFEAVRRELPGAARPAGALVIFPDEQSGQARLAWKFALGNGAARWRYYVDAHTGQVLYRYDFLQHLACVTSGVVSGLVYDVDPDSTPQAGRYFAHERVYVQDGSQANSAVTDAKGFFCSGAKGKISTDLQGPFASVSNFTGPNIHYDNGGGVWSTIGSPVSSPHPYPANAVLISTINLTGTAADVSGMVEFLPVFTNFHVGRWVTDNFGGEGGDIGVDDQVAVLDTLGNPVGAYLGDRGSFSGAGVYGKSLNIRLKSTGDPGAKNTGYDVVVSSYLVLNDAANWNVNGSSVLWTQALAANGFQSEINAFYHINKIHDYFMYDADLSSASFIGNPVNGLVYVGPSFDGAFFSPEDDNLNFGDFSAFAVSDILTQDATVPHHEYTHYMVDKIWPILNFGQAGAISEGNADYWSATSLNDSSIGKYYQRIRNAPNPAPPLRELDCLVHPPCQVYSANAWQGEIHSDSIYLSQAMWDVRRSRINALGNVNNIGVICADRLMFGALFWFPESFEEYYAAILKVDAAGVNRPTDIARFGGTCGGPGSAQSAITAAFGAHGLAPSPADAYDPNGGFETAVDISTIGTVAATIFPGAEQDFYSFAAGPGTISLSLSLPPDGNTGFHKAYMLTLYDGNHNALLAAEPAYDGTNTIGGTACQVNDCDTTSSVVTMTLSTTTANYYFVRVSGGTAGGDPLSTGSMSAVNSTLPYTLQASFTRSGAFSAGTVGSVFDRDMISFSIPVTYFAASGIQNVSFAYAQLRDQSGGILPNTIAAPPATAPALLPGWGGDPSTGGGSMLTFVSSRSALGGVSGQVQLSAAKSFATRFPAVGTVYLEVFGYTLWGSTVTLGLSQAINLQSESTNLQAWNNILNPNTGGKTTVKYDLPQPGPVKVQLFTLSGNLVKTLVDGFFPAGKGSVDWYGQNDAGSTVASGVYLLHIKAQGLNKTQKIVVVK